jgi:hypothetical protein
MYDRGLEVLGKRFTRICVLKCVMHTGKPFTLLRVIVGFWPMILQLVTLVFIQNYHFAICKWTIRQFVEHHASP